MKTALITNLHIQEMGGSELFTLELASSLISMSYDVTIATKIIGEPLLSICKQQNIKVVYNTSITQTEYDLLWVLHSPMARWVMDKKITAVRKIYMSCSPYEAAERPPLDCIQFYDTILSNSEETKQMLSNIGVDSPRLFLNSVTDEIINSYQKNKPNKCINIATVSNHYPTEVLSAVDILRQKDKNVDVYGLHHGKVAYINGALLSKYDCVITIGRTVQYSLCAGIPVYCYDRFGGDGYITLENMDQSERHNYSGRFTKKKLSPDLLADDIIKNREHAYHQRNQLRNIAINRYSLINNIKELLNV